MKNNIKVRVFRYDPEHDPNPHYKSYEVPYQEKMRVLDVLHYIHDHYDGSLAYRWICRAGQCGSCTIMINGKPGLACRTEATVQMLLEPIDIFPIVKDLVVDLEKGYIKLNKIRPFLHGKGKEEDFLKNEEFEQLKEFRRCIECWSCVAGCPVVKEAWEDYGGPLEMRKLAELNLRKDILDRVSIAFAEGVYNCTTCKTCVEVCPQEIEIPKKAIQKLRNRAVEKGLAKEQHKKVSKLVVDTKRSVSRETTPFLETIPEVIGEGEPVLFFTGCMIDYRLQELGKSVVKVLNNNRFRVIIPKEQECCGSPLLKVGMREVGESQALKTIKLFSAYSKKFDTSEVVMACPGCSSTMKEDYPEIAEQHHLKIPFKIYDINEFLVDLDLKPLKPLKISVTFHDPCHLNRGQNIKEEPRILLNKIPRLKLIEMMNSDQCCGAGGGARSGNKPLSLRIGLRKAQYIKDTNTDAVVTSCPFCTYQLKEIIQEAKLKQKVYNVIELLDMAYKVLLCARS